MNVFKRLLISSCWSRNLAQLAVLLIVVGCAKSGGVVSRGPENSSESAIGSVGELVDHSRRAPLSQEELAKRRFDTTLQVEGPLVGGKSFTAYLVSYRHAGLKLHALVAVPRSPAPSAGYPVVVANHGYVPEPPNYGVTSEGLNSRPGDYYRSVPELYASRGFLVVMPDYRGHNNSDGYEYINPQDDESVAYYAEDVVALMAGLDDIEGANTSRVFMWSHSMGGPVALRALLATKGVKAATFWSTMALDSYLAGLPELDVPVAIHHSMGDTGTAYENSAWFSGALQALDSTQEFYSYDTGEHYFSVPDRNIAADRDASLFRSF